MKGLLKFFKGYRVESFLAPIFKCLEAIFELLVPLAVARIIDVGINDSQTDTIWKMCLVMLALALIGLICAISAQYFSAKAAVRVSAKIRSALFERIQRFSYSETDKAGYSTLITRMTSDINSVQTGINMFLRLFMRSPFIVFGAMIMAFTINARLALIFVVTILVLAVIVFGIMLISIPIMKRSQSQLDKVVGKVRSNYNGTRVIRAFNKESDEITEFESKNSALTKIQIFSGRISALMNPLTYVVINFAVIVLIKSGAVSVDSGVISQGELVALYNYMSQILVELIKLASLIITLNKAAASASRVSAVLDKESETFDCCTDIRSDDESHIRFENVSFAYNESGDRALDGISFSVLRGQTVGIIGGTGSGKSTLVNLIPALYTPVEGEVYINGRPAKSYDEDDLRKDIAIVPQKAMLFKGTVRSNLLWGNENATDEELWEALDAAQALSFIKDKPGGLDEPVLQGGKNFSGGQRQRLTIARALVKKPSIIILDDSASALDYATESSLMRAISSLPTQMTRVVVSQRASSILGADQIIVMDDGEMVGIGDHNTLIDTCDTYREIYTSQFGVGGDK